jgi:hypothetical protein
MYQESKRKKLPQDFFKGGPSKKPQSEQNIFENKLETIQSETFHSHHRRFPDNTISNLTKNQSFREQNSNFIGMRKKMFKNQSFNR